MKFYINPIQFIIVIILCLTIVLNIAGAKDDEKSEKPKAIVIITPHPDDAEASCGGLILNSIAAGDEVIILTMTGGELGIWERAKRKRIIR
jgi:hypothetical protein